MERAGYGNGSNCPCLRDFEPKLTCVCVFSENEEEYIAVNQPDRSNISSIFAIPYHPDEGDDYDDSDCNGFDRNPRLASLDGAMDSVAFYPCMSRMIVTPPRGPPLYRDRWWSKN